MKIQESKIGLVRVGRCTYNNRVRSDPSYPSFSPILVLTKSSKYGDLGPYVLKDEKGRIMENYWQASKIYEEIPESKQPASYYDKTVIWSWPAEKHVDIDKDKDQYKIRRAYLHWRKALQYCSHPVRYPVGYEHRHKCLFAIPEDEKGDLMAKKLGIPESREQIYSKTYIELVKERPLFHTLKQRLQDGENLLIIEVDGPHQESLEYYKKVYNVNENFIENGTILANQENLSIMLNDPLHSYGHGYCLAAALLDLDIKAK